MNRDGGYGLAFVAGVAFNVGNIAIIWLLARRRRTDAGEFPGLALAS